MSPLPFARPYRLAILAVTLRAHALHLAEDGKHLEAQRAMALHEAAHHGAGGDRQGMRLALSEARFLRRAARRQRHAVLA